MSLPQEGLLEGPSSRELVAANEKAAWTQILGREVILPQMPESLTDHAMHELQGRGFSIIHIPSLHAPLKGFFDSMHVEEEQQPIIFTDEINTDNPGLLQTEKDVVFFEDITGLMRDRRFDSLFDPFGRWVAIETWDGLTIDEVATVPDRESLYLAEGRYDLPVTRFLRSWNQTASESDKASRASDTAKVLEAMCKSLGLKDKTLTVPTLVDSYLLSKRGLWKPSEGGEWTETLMLTRKDNGEPLADYRYAVSHMEPGKPHYDVLEGGQSHYYVGLRPMITFK